MGKFQKIGVRKNVQYNKLELQELNSSSHTGERAIRKTYCYAGSGASGSSLPASGCGDGSSVKNLGYCNDGGGDNHIGQMCGDGGQTFGASGAPECAA